MSRKRPHHGSRRRPTHARPKKRRASLQGVVQVVRPGLARVQTPEGTFAVARRGLREAMNGDEVQVSLVPMHGRAGDPVAYVQAVLTRACTDFLGTFGVADPLGVVTPLDGRLSHDFFVLPDDTSAQRLGVGEGDVVQARIVEYPTRQSAGVVTIERRLGSAQELDVSVEAIIASYGIDTEFSEAALDEADGMRLNVDAALAADPLRRDLRDQMCVTVDPVDARDFDDAVGAVRKEDGGYRLYVHIADVSYYVGWSTSVDLEARQRACSVYLVDRVVPMLPERLCNDLCSLRPNEDRLAMTVWIDVDKHGQVIGSQACPSVIRSSARLSYDQVDAFLQGALDVDELPCAPDRQVDVAQALAVLDELAQLRLAVRELRGAIDFPTVESKVLLDDRGHATGVSVRTRTRATGLVEEAMLLANESVAQMLADRDIATAYRVHERPSPDDLAACVSPLRELGLLRGSAAEALVAGDPHAIREVLGAARGTGASYLANTLLLRAQKRAVYLPHNEGHYALGAKAYCHFTSPIRRYPDVLVHRALRCLLEGLPQSRERTQMERELPQLCKTCSDRERVADAAERASQRVKMAELYGQRIGQSCSGTVVGCERFGLFVLLDETYAEGLLPARALGDEWFFMDRERMTLTGESSGHTWRVGQRVAVVVVQVDVPQGRIDLALAKGRTA